ncbi:MAG: hypothetical protein ACKOTH_06910, partial [Solirubrobacterales bacterium]
MTDAARAADGGQDLPVPVTSPASAPTAEDPFPAPRRSSDLADPTRAFNREISWVDFNDRVLQLAESPPDEQPLMERLKFCAIYSSNQDEFFMVRVGQVARPARRREGVLGARVRRRRRHHG